MHTTSAPEEPDRRREISNLLLQFVSKQGPEGSKCITTRNVANLYRLAQRYEVPELRSECVTFLNNCGLDPGNWAALLRISNILNNRRLFDRCADFFLTNCGTISQQVYFRTVSEEDLLRLARKGRLPEFAAHHRNLWKAVRQWIASDEHRESSLPLFRSILQ